MQVEAQVAPEVGVQCSRQLVVESDEVRLHLFENLRNHTNQTLQAFRLVDRKAFRQLLIYQRPKTSDSQIPRRTTIRNAILQKAEKIDGLDKATIEVFRLFVCRRSKYDRGIWAGYYWAYLSHIRWVDVDPWLPIPLIDYSLRRRSYFFAP